MLPDILIHPQNDYFLQLRKSFVSICAEAPDPQCAAAILCVFEYWTRVKLAHKSQAEIDNTISVKEGMEPCQDTSLWIYKTEDNLQKETLCVFGTRKIRESREWLVEREFLEKRNNPNHKWDRTLQFRVNIAVVQRALDGQDYRFDPAELPDGTGQTAGTIPETTSKKTSTKNQSPVSETGTPHPGSLSFGPVNPSTEERQKRATTEQHVEDMPKKPYTNLELYIMARLDVNKIVPGIRTAFDTPVRWVSKKLEDRESPSPNELWDTSAKFQAFVKEVLEERMKETRGKKPITPKVFKDFLCSGKNHTWFHEGYEPDWKDHAPRNPDDPDGVAHFDATLHDMEDDE